MVASNVMNLILYALVAAARRLLVAPLVLRSLSAGTFNREQHSPTLNLYSLSTHEARTGHLFGSEQAFCG